MDMKGSDLVESNAVNITYIYIHIHTFIYMHKCTGKDIKI